MDFYKQVRPWGFWKPIHEKVIKENPDFKKNTGFARDMFNIFFGIIAQTALVALPVFIVLKAGNWIILTIVTILITGFILKKSWYDKLEA